MQKTGPHPRPTELKLAFYQDPQVVLSTFQLRNTVLKQSCLVLGCALERGGGLPQTLLAVVVVSTVTLLLSSRACGDTLLPGPKHCGGAGPSSASGRSPVPSRRTGPLVPLRSSGQESAEEEPGGGTAAAR